MSKRPSLFVPAGVYPCLRWQQAPPWQRTGLHLLALVTDRGPGKRPRFRTPTDAELEALPSGPDLTDEEVARINGGKKK